jgi:D-psicose/D-tagatose/L-ribulose 3-epimerase
VRVIETPLLDPEGFDFIGTRHAAERLGIEIVCLLGLPDELDVLTQAD